MFAQLQYFVMLALTFALFAVEVWAFVDALRHRPEQYVAAGKRTKGFWLALTGAAAVVGFLTLPPLSGINALGLIGLAAVVVSAIYLTDVRPAVRREAPRRGGW